MRSNFFSSARAQMGAVSHARDTPQSTQDFPTESKQLPATRIASDQLRKSKSISKGKAKKSPTRHDSPAEEEEEEEDSSDDEEDESEEEEEVEGEEEKDSDEEDDEDDSDDDSSSSSDDSSDSSEDSTSSSDDSDCEDKTDIKVHVLPSNDIRGFSIRLTDAGLETIQKSLKKDYGAITNLFFRDSDGDAVTIKSAHDLKYASRSSKSQPNPSSSNTSVKIKLFAETESSSVALAVTTTESNSELLQGSTKQSTVRFTPVSQVNFKGQGGASQTESAVETRGSGALSFSMLPLEGSLSMSRDASQGVLPSPSRSALNYEVVWKKGELLGSGSFGKVYSGMNLSSGERIAVKEVVLRRGKKHRQQAQALQLEVKILSSLDHPNIIKYLGTEYTKQTLRIFLELANDGTIKDALNEFGAFPEPLVRRYTADILEGLWFLHSKKFIHRDIKPTNLLVSGGRVKLGDFGCSTSIVDDESTVDGFHNTVAGTAVYMAPEVMQAGSDVDLVVAASQNSQGGKAPAMQPSDTQSHTVQRVAPVPALGLRRIDSQRSVLSKRRKGYGKRADIWSVGITLIEMSTGRAPFPNAGAAIYAVCVSKQFPSFPDQFSPDAHSFLDRCLVEDPKIRATSAELRLLPFMNVQSADEMRAQTAAMPRTAHTLSNVTVHLPEDFSFLQSPRADEIESREGRACRGDDSKMTSFTGEDWFRTAVTSDMASNGAAKASAARVQTAPAGQQRGREFMDTDSGSIAQRKLGNRTPRMDPLGVESKVQTEFDDSDSEDGVPHEDPFKSTSSRMFYTACNVRQDAAPSLSDDEDMFRRDVDVPCAAQVSANADSSAANKIAMRRRHDDHKSVDFHSAKECSDDEDCKTGYSSYFS